MGERCADGKRVSAQESCWKTCFRWNLHRPAQPAEPALGAGLGSRGGAWRGPRPGPSANALRRRRPRAAPTRSPLRALPRLGGCGSGRRDAPSARPPAGLRRLHLRPVLAVDAAAPRAAPGFRRGHRRQVRGGGRGSGQRKGARSEEGVRAVGGSVPGAEASGAGGPVPDWGSGLGSRPRPSGVGRAGWMGLGAPAEGAGCGVCISGARPVALHPGRGFAEGDAASSPGGARSRASVGAWASPREPCAGRLPGPGPNPPLASVRTRSPLSVAAVSLPASSSLPILSALPLGLAGIRSSQVLHGQL